MPATTSNESRRGSAMIASMTSRNAGAVGEQRHQVLEDDAGLREVGHVDDVPGHQVGDHGAAVAPLGRAPLGRHRRLAPPGRLPPGRPPRLPPERLPEPAGLRAGRPASRPWAPRRSSAATSSACSAVGGRLRRARPRGAFSPPLGRHLAAGDRRAAGQDPLGVRPDLGLVLLERHQQRRGEEDRGVDRDAHTDEEHQAEVLQRARAEQAGADEQQAADRQQRDQTGVDRPHQRLVDGQVGRLRIGLRGCCR